MFKPGFGNAVIRYRWVIVLLTLAAVAVAGSGGRFLGFSTDYRVFFSEDNPQLQAFETLQNTYTKNDNIMLVLAPKDQKVFTRKTLSVVEGLTRDSWQIPYSIRVDSISNFQHTRADADGLVVEDLVKGAADFSDDDLERVQRIALAEPLLRDRLIAPSAALTGINITINLPGESQKEGPEVVAFVRGLAERTRNEHPDLDVYLTGVVFMNNAFAEAGEQDMMTLAPIMYLLVIVIMVVSLRSFWSAFVTVLVIGFSIVTGMGLAGWLGILLTPVSANAPTIILTLAVADSIHILVSMLHEMRLGKSKREAIVESLRINQQPVLITSVTTAIGFLSMNFSDAPPFRDLGNIVALGVMAAYVYSIFFLPALMSLLHLKVHSNAEEHAELCDRIADFVINNRRLLFWGTLAVMLFLMAQLPKLEIDERFNEYFDTRYQFRKDNDFVTQNLTGFETIEYSLSAGESGGISNPAYLAKLEEFAQWYRQQPGVMHVNVLTDIMKRLNKNLHDDDEAFYRIPQSRDLSAQYLLLYELSLPYGLDLNNQINVDKSSTRFTATVDNISTREALDMEDRAQAWLREHAPPEMASHGASPMIMFSHIAKRNIYSMAGGTILALGLISGLLILVLRSFKLGLTSLVPNLIPLFMTFGLWGLLVREVGLAVSVVAPVALGIIVDDTVHLLVKYRRARMELGKTAIESVRYSIHTVGTALVLTSLILVCGFSVLSFSGFSMNSHLGMMNTIAIVVALLTDFLFLPPLLMKIEEK